MISSRASSLIPGFWVVWRRPSPASLVLVCVRPNGAFQGRSVSDNLTSSAISRRHILSERSGTPTPATAPFRNVAAVVIIGYQTCWSEKNSYFDIMVYQWYPREKCLFLLCFLIHIIIHIYFLLEKNKRKKYEENCLNKVSLCWPWNTVFLKKKRFIIIDHLVYSSWHTTVKTIWCIFDAYFK